MFLNSLRTKWLYIEYGNFNQGVLTKDDATIWIYYRGDNIRKDVNITSKLKK